MAYFGFTNKLLKGATIEIFNYGNCQRDFTSIDDIVDGVIRVVQGAPEKETGEDGLLIQPYAVYNIGNQNPENLLDFVDILQQELIAAGVLPAAPPAGRTAALRQMVSGILPYPADLSVAQHKMVFSTMPVFHNNSSGSSFLESRCETV